MTDERRKDHKTRDRIEEIKQVQESKHDEFIRDRYEPFVRKVVLFMLVLGVGVTLSLVLFGCQQRDNTKASNAAKSTADKVDKGVTKGAEAQRESARTRRSNYVLACKKRNKQNLAINSILKVAPQDLLATIPKKSLEGLAQESCESDARELIK